MVVDGMSGAAGDEDTLMVDPITVKSENPKSARGAASRRRKKPEVRRLSCTVLMSTSCEQQVLKADSCCRKNS